MNIVKSTGSLSISLSESKDFSVLSGDFNPMHVDDVYARRLQYGRTVLHGIHHLLRVLNEGIRVLEINGHFLVDHTSGVFHTPVSINEVIDYEISFEESTGVLDIISTVNCKRSMSLQATLRCTCNQKKTSLIPDTSNSEQMVEVNDFPPTRTSGTTSLTYNEDIAKRLFPCLTQKIDHRVVSCLLSTTKIVGMHCPGLHSIFSGLDLTFEYQNSKSINTDISYEVKKIDERVRLVEIEFTGAYARGLLKTFFRPPPVDQPSSFWITEQVKPDRFSSQSALIIGGSRGIGETTAKTIAAGGGEVVISYTRGLQDAKRVMSEIVESGGKCEILELDVLGKTIPSGILDSRRLSHIYYFASPKILPNLSSKWDVLKHQEYLEYYVTAFDSLIENISTPNTRNKNQLTVVYPSTVFIDEIPRGFFEYAAAKMAGEIACKKYNAIHQNIHCTYPRLPKLNTDQTASLVKNNSASAFEVMYKLLQDL